ncbi:MAG: hypothetical protein PHO08_11125 [Methylococcales bacterium]|nr:hypothetical protein [Methylococcales bacterium]
MVQETLSHYDINTPIVVRDGKVYRQVLRQNKTYTSAAGPVQVERSLYRAEEQCICPLELQAGIIENYWTPSAARLGCYVTAQLSPYQGEKLFQEFGQLQPSKSALSRLSTQLGETWESELTQLEQLFCADITIPENAVTVSASLDGIMIPLNKAAANGYQVPELVDNPSAQEKSNYQVQKAKAFYREASCAAINFYDEDGERLKTIRFGRMPEAGKKTLKNQLQQSISTILSQQPELNLVKLADGAADNWRYFRDHLLPGKGLEVLDYFHASEHLNEAMEAAYGKGSATAVAKYQEYKSRLKNEMGGIEKVINTLKYHSQKNPDNKKLATELDYFRNNRHRMQYAQALKSNYPIGSGVTEATCKTLVTQRMKCAGMRWNIKGGQGVLTARSLIQSEQFDKGWNVLSKT